MSSFSSGHGDKAVQPGRFKYAANREERRAPGFAELDWSATALRTMAGMQTNLETESLVFERTVASSLIKCGLFPVFSSCSITPTTISSLIPSVSYLLRLDGSGDGGGVSSYAFLPPLFGLKAKETFLVEDEVEDRGRDV